MLKLYTWTTPNGYKVPLMLEELSIPYELHMVDISKGEQKSPEFLAMNPNHKVPVLVDDDADGGPITIFESGAILLYLAEKTGKFMPTVLKEKYEAMEWLMFQMASVGPMFGQAAHFMRFAPEKIEYAINRYTEEAKRLLGVLNTRLGEVAYLAGDYSVADIATYPWIRTGVTLGAFDLADYSNVKRWYGEIEARPATTAAYEKIDAAKPTT